MLAKIIGTILLANSFLISIQYAQAATANPPELKLFVPASYQQMINSHPDRPLMLTIWSRTCTICMQKMPLLSALKKEWPDIHVITLSTDDAAESEQIVEILAQHGLNTADNWIFADSNAQKLRYEIDPKWFGELPRTYFIDKTRQRRGISGGLTREQYETVFRELLN